MLLRAVRYRSNLIDVDDNDGSTADAATSPAGACELIRPASPPSPTDEASEDRENPRD